MTAFRPLHAHYDLLRQLGHGAMAEVMLARRKVDGAMFAVKRALSHVTQPPGIADRFAEEVRVMPFIAHPNIVRTEEVCQDERDGTLAIVLEFIEGQSLLAVGRAALDRGRLLSHQAVAHIGGEVLSALGYLHDVAIPQGERGVVHRDLTPSNVLLRPTGSAALIDFGVALAAGRQPLTKTGAVVGKIGYMAPEVLRGDRGGKSADLFSVAVMLYEMLCGHSPFVGETAADVVDAAVAGRVTEPQAHVPSLTDDVCRLLTRGLAPKMEDRFEDAWEMAMDLGAALPLPDPSDVLSLLTTLSPKTTAKTPVKTTEEGSGDAHRPVTKAQMVAAPPVPATAAASFDSPREVTVTQVASNGAMGVVPDRASYALQTREETTRTTVTPQEPEATVTQVGGLNRQMDTQEK